MIQSLEELEWAWRPTVEQVASSPIGRFAARHGLGDLQTVRERATRDPSWFWAAVVEDLGIEWMRPFDTVIDVTDGPEWARFFVGGRLNMSDNAVNRWIRRGRGESAALVWMSNDDVASMSYAHLAEIVSTAAGALLQAGITKGSAVGVYLPMWPEAVITILAAAHIGAVAVPMFSGYGAAAVGERLADAGAVALVTTDVAVRRGRPVEMLAAARSAVAGLDTECSLIVIRRAGTPLGPNELDWDRILERAERVGAVSCSADDPLLLLYTSGSTARPKGCVHTHGGLPIKVAQEARHGLGADVGSRILWLTDMGWVMGPWLTFAALLNGGTAVLFDGVPDWPAPDRVWEAAEATSATILGIAPTVIRSLKAHGAEWPDRHDLETVRALGSTGEPWNLDPWRWCFEHVGKGRTPIVNICGGTECGGSIVSGSVAAPIKPMSFAGPVPGMDADVVDDAGLPLRGAVGELVVRAPWPGMTRGFWRDRERYLDSYWRRWPGVWHHGDFAYIDRDGCWYILGRSDDTIKVAGKRIGPAEVESLLVMDPDVLEAAAIGVPHEIKGQNLVCLVVLHAGADEAVACARLANLVAERLGRPMRPSAVHAIPALPKTRNGKVMRRVARSLYVGADPGDLSALDDPRALDALSHIRLMNEQMEVTS